MAGHVVPFLVAVALLVGYLKFVNPIMYRGYTRLVYGIPSMPFQSEIRLVDAVTFFAIIGAGVCVLLVGLAAWGSRTDG